MISHGTSSYQQNLRLCFDSRNPKSWNGSIFTDLITGNNENNIGDPSWLNNIRYTTISMVIEWYNPATGYADHPISKFNATLQNASMTFYMFQNYLGNGADGQWQFIAGNGAWTGLGNGGTVQFQQKHHIALQFSTDLGSQVWFNGTKNGNRGAGGILGNSHTAGTSGIGFEGANPNGNGHTKMYHLSWWDCEVSDEEMVKQYKYLKSTYGVI